MVKDMLERPPMGALLLPVANLRSMVLVSLDAAPTNVQKLTTLFTNSEAVEERGGDDSES